MTDITAVNLLPDGLIFIALDDGREALLMRRDLIEWAETTDGFRKVEALQFEFTDEGL